MVTVKELKPYHIKVDTDYVHIILAYQYFTISIDDTIYKFVPIDAKEITIDRRTKRIQNVKDVFAFQKGKDVIHIGISELIYIPQFLIQIHAIADPFYLVNVQTEEEAKQNIDTFICQVEQQNVKRLINCALDNRDEAAFYKLVNYL